MSAEISEVTRRAIIDFFTISQTHWSGRLQENEFLTRLYDLNSLPSEDYRYETAASDIFQYRVRNSDWENDWVFYDSRFNLLYESDEEFLRFLCETVHPIVRPDTDEARKLVDVYNKELAPDGWGLVVVKEVSGRPIFAAQQVGARCGLRGANGVAKSRSTGAGSPPPSRHGRDGGTISGRRPTPPVIHLSMEFLQALATPNACWRQSSKMI